jgi:hypothetical protein
LLDAALTVASRHVKRWQNWWRSAMGELEKALSALTEWQKTNGSEKKRAKRCLEAIRWSCEKAGLRLPPPRPKPHNTALGCYELLVAHPEQWGWKAIHHKPDGTLQTPCLLFLKRCGQLPDGRWAGHICILSNNVLRANVDYQYNSWWKSRVVAAFIPA